MRPEIVRLAKRVAVVASAVATVGGLAYGAASAVAKSEDAQRRLLTVEQATRQSAADIAEIKGKVDAMMVFFRIPQPVTP